MKIVNLDIRLNVRSGYSSMYFTELYYSRILVEIQTHIPISFLEKFERTHLRREKDFS